MAGILIVANRHFNSQILVNVLDSEQHQTWEASDETEAFAHARSKHPDLIICDVLLPTMNGCEFVRRLRDDVSLIQPPVIFVTEYFLRREALSLAAACGVSLIIYRQYEADQILRAVNSALGIEGCETSTPTLTCNELSRDNLAKSGAAISDKLDELSALNDKMKALVELDQPLAQERDPHTLLNKYCDLAREIIGAQLNVLELYDEDTHALREVHTVGLKSEIAGSAIPTSIHNSVYSRQIQNGSLCRGRILDGNPEAAGFPPDFSARSSWLIVPIIFRKNLYGSFCFGDKLGADEFSEMDEQLARMLVLQMATALENATLYNELQLENQALYEALRISDEKLRLAHRWEAIGKLTGGAAHDFNNLLTVISGYSELSLMKLEKDNPIYSNINEIKKAGARASSLSRQLLAFNRRLVFQPYVLDLNTVVEDVLKMLQRVIGEDVDLITSLEPSLGQVKADPSQIEQVVLNLSVYAREAMLQGGRLTIETANVFFGKDVTSALQIRPGQYVLLTISGTQYGLDTEAHIGIVDSLSTTNELVTSARSSLSTVYDIVKELGGEVCVTSEQVKGTTFEIFLPRFVETVEDNRSVDFDEGSPKGVENVLVAEDEEQVRRVTREILELNGFSVLEAANGKDALTSFMRSEKKINLIVTDAVMPKMGGRELVENLKRLDPGIRVVYMSGYNDESIVRHGLLDQGVDFLQKPFTPEALMCKVREVLDGPPQT